MKCHHPVEFTQLIHILVIVGSVFIAYHLSLDAGLVFDDQVAIVRNEDIRPNTSLLNLFKNDYWGTPLNSVSRFYLVLDIGGLIKRIF